MKTIVSKVIVLGPQVIRYVHNSFMQEVIPTVGASFVSCKLLIDNIAVKLQIWDTTGEERFKCVAPTFYRNANAALVVFDITSVQSFESMQDWVLELKRNVDNPMVLSVVGNKIDLAKNRQVSRDEAIQYAKSIGATYHECSAMQDQGVVIVFDNMAGGLIKLYGTNVDHNLKMYDTENVKNTLVTDTGEEENLTLSINSVADGNMVKSKCC